MSASTSSSRLPRTVLPVRYDLHLTADPAKPEYSATLRLAATASKAFTELRLHAKGLRIKEAALVQGKTRQTAKVSSKAADEQVVLRVPRKVAAGKLTVEVVYTGTVSNGMAGLYLSKDGPDSCLVTQCEATDARSFVPCFDEPDFKSSWAWTVTAPKDATVLTNGAQTSRKVAGPLATTTFKPTPPMASYLAAVVVGDFAALPAKTVNGVPFRVWALGGREALGRHARDFAAELLPWFEKAYGQKYAFGKYDQVAVPSFAFGAMENAGLVTFRPSLLLVDPAASSWDDRRDVALVVAHEFAHMWFGDLVTMAWWDDLWLNEAFAEWMAHRAVDALAPDLDVWTRFRQRAGSAMGTDALAKTHAIYTPVQSPAEASELFDAITYGKGSAVLRMLHAYLGDDTFRAGLRSYMGEFRLGNAKGSDLWRHLGQASGQDVSGIMQDWITQPGHPVVSAAWERGALTLRQERARSSPLAPAEKTLWRIPLVIRYEDAAGVHEHRHLLAAAEERVALPVEGTLKWLWPNAGDVGFLRSAIAAPLRPGLAQAAATLPPAERVALLRDAGAQLRAGQMTPENYLAWMRSLLDPEAPYEVLQHQVGLLREFERILETRAPAALPRYRAFVARVLGPGLRAVGTKPAPKDTPQKRLQRAALLRAVAGIGRDPSAIAAARAVAAAERKAPAKVDANLSGVAVGIEAILGDAATLETHLATFLARREKKASPQDTERYLYVLGGFRAPEQVARVLGLCKDGTIAPQAVGPILRGMLVEPHAQAAAWDFVKTNWAFVKERLGEAWIANLVEASGELPSPLLQDMVSFWSSRLEGTASQAFARGEERIRERAEFLDRFAPALAAWVQAA